MTERHLSVHDLVDELTRPHRHRETYTAHEGSTTWTKGHVTSVPALVHQLLGATPAGSGAESGSGGAKSRPAARIESIDTLMLIDHEASMWVKRLGEDDPGDTLEIVGRKRVGLGPVCGRRCVHRSCVSIRRGDHIERRAIPGSGTIACLNLLHGLLASAERCDRPRGKRGCCIAHNIEHDIRRWWTQARIVSGWDSPAWRPDNTCPVCEVRRSLRVSLLASSAVCIECREVWDPDTIGLLAEHIRAENLEDDAPLAEGA